MSPRKKEFTKEDIVNAAFEVVKKQGWEKLSARTIARVLNSSTMPIYSYIKSMKKLDEKIAYKASELLLKYQTTQRTGLVFLDMGIGYIIFAKEEKNLFRYMFMMENVSSNLQERMTDYSLNIILEKMKEDPSLKSLDKQKMQSILEKMWIFVHGLASLISFGDFENDSEEYITDLIRETGRYVIQGEINNNEG